MWLITLDQLENYIATTLINHHKIYYYNKKYISMLLFKKKYTEYRPTSEIIVNEERRFLSLDGVVTSRS